MHVDTRKHKQTQADLLSFQAASLLNHLQSHLNMKYLQNERNKQSIKY